MQVVSVSVTVRESKGNGEGWRSLELGAQAQVFPSEDWREAQQVLHGALTHQIELMRANREGQDGHDVANDDASDNGNGNGHQEHEQVEYAQVNDEKEVVCPTHHKAKKGKYGFYCPTKMADGTWCSWRYRV